MTTTEVGKHLLINPEPDPERGNTAVYRDHLDVLRSRRITAELPAMPWEKVFLPHPATCTEPKTEQLTLPDGVTSLTAYRHNRR